MDYLCAKLRIRHNYATPYYPQCNGLNERFNGELVRMLTKVTSHHGKNWDLELPCALRAYRTAVKTSTKFSPFHLVYGKEALMPIEIEIPAIKMLLKLTDEVPDYYMERLLYLQQVQLDRFLAVEHYANMQEEQIKRINAEIKSKNIVKGDLVLRYNSKLDHTFQKKFQIKWEGPFQVMEKFDNGTYQLADLDGALHANRVNSFRLKRYVARMMTFVLMICWKTMWP